jgi:hypothetical protein
VLETLPTHFFTQEVVTQVQSKSHYTTLPLLELVRGLLPRTKEGIKLVITHISPPKQTNSIRLLTGEQLPLDELDFTEFFDATPEGLLKTGEMWLFFSGKKTYKSDELESLSLSEDLISLLEPMFQPEFEILDFPETPPPTLSFTPLLSLFFDRIRGFFHKVRVV